MSGRSSSVVTMDWMEESFRRQRELAEREGYLQGLRMVPIGAVMLMEGAIGAGWIHVGGVANAAILAAALGLLVTIQALYSYLHGWPWLVERPGSAGIARDLGLGLLVVVVGTGAVAVDLFAPTAISLTGVAMAGMVAIFWLAWGTAHRLHYAIMALLIVVSSFAPLAGLTKPAMYAGSPLMYIFLGIVVVAGGILDHVVLMRMRAAARLKG